MSKEEIMRLANALILELQQCDDGDFVEVVVDAVSCAELFYEDEIEDWSEENDNRTDD